MATPAHSIGEIPLRTNLDGSLSSIAAEFDPSGHTLYVRQRVEAVTAIRAVQWYSPDVCVPLFAVLAILAVVLFLRTWRRPRARGKVYCRACNYLLVPPLIKRDERNHPIGAPEARCPECGVDLAHRSPQSGTSRAARLWPVWAVVVPLMLVCTALTAWGLEWRASATGPAFRPKQTWPIPGLATYMGSWTLQKRYSVRYGFGDPMVISKWVVPEFKSAGVLAKVDPMGDDNIGLSADGSRFVAIENTDDGAVWVTIIETASGKLRKTRLNPSGYGAAIIGSGRVIARSGAGTALYVKFQTSSTSRSATSVTDELLRIDLNTFDRALIARVESPFQTVGGSQESPYTAFCVDEISPTSARWVHAAYIWDANRVLTKVLVTSGVEGQEQTATHDVDLVGTGATSMYPPRLIDDGRTLELPLYATTIKPQLDLQTGAVSRTTVPSAQGAAQPMRTPNARLEVRVPGGVRVGTLLRQPTPIDIVELSTNRTLSSFTLRPGGWPYAISPDGRFLVSLEWREVRGLRGVFYGLCTEPIYEAYLEIWDTSIDPVPAHD